MRRELQVFTTKKDEKYHQEVVKQIRYSNALRGRIMMSLVFLLEFLLIIGIDIPTIIRKGFTEGNTGLYLMLHSFLFLVGGISMYISHLYIRKPNRNLFKILNVDLYFVTAAGLFLFGITIINGLDLLYNSSTTMLMFFIVIISLFAIIKPKHYMIMMVLIYATYLATVLIFQKDTLLVLSNIVNGTLAFIVSTLAGIMSYNFFYDYTLKTIKLEELSITDDLTKLLNRRKLDEVLTHELAHANRKHYLISCLMIDIDDFKKLNDKYGHLIGDQVIQELATILQTNVREEDSIIRYGGEEFLILLTNSDSKIAYDKAEMIRQSVQKLRLDNHITITISIGVTTFHPGDTKESLIERSDQALYEAKRNGKNRVVQR